MAVTALQIISFVPYLFVLPICIYGNYRLYQYKDATFLQKRNKALTFGLNASFFLLIMLCLLFHPFNMFAADHWLNELNDSVLVFAWVTILFGLVTKNWLIYWRYYFQYYTLQSEWQILINSTHDTHSNRFIKYNHKFGSRVYVSKALAIYCACSVIFNILFFALRRSTNKVVAIISRPFAVLSVLTLLSLFVAYAVIVCKTPNYHDMYFIHWESKIHAKVLLSLGVTTCLFVAFVISGVIPLGDLVVFKFIFPVTAIGLTVMTFISTFAVIGKNKKNVATVSGHSFQIEQPAKKITVERVLSNGHATHLFIQHLSTEFSMELVLCIIEASQFVDYLQEINATNTPDDNEDMNMVSRTVKRIATINLQENVPMSEIITADDDLANKIKRFYLKYIDNGSEFEVNIPFAMRTRCRQFVHSCAQNGAEIDADEWISILESLREEMRKLLMHSLNRFKQSAA